MDLNQEVNVWVRTKRCLGHNKMVVGGQKEEVLMSCDHWAATTVLSSTIATTISIVTVT